MQDFFRFGKHHNIKVICLAHYAKDVLPVVREIFVRLYITNNIQFTFFDSITKRNSIKLGFLNNIQQYRDQMDLGIIEYDTRSRKYKITISM